MSLVNSSVKQGNFLFKYRGQFPVLLFFLVIPFLYFFPSKISEDMEIACNILAVFISFFGCLIRFYTIGTTPKGTSGRNTKKQIADHLNYTGIYSLVRHPLYLGNYFIWFGITVFTYNIYFIITIGFLFWIYYLPIISAEEDFLKRKFGHKYLEFACKIPKLIPSFKNYKKTSLSLSIKSILRREYAGFLAIVISFSYIDILRRFLKTKKIDITEPILYILIISLIVVMILRSLKHYTNILEEKGRS